VHLPKQASHLETTKEGGNGEGGYHCHRLQGLSGELAQDEGGHSLTKEGRHRACREGGEEGRSAREGNREGKMEAKRT
jgi:hypothetical protein